MRNTQITDDIVGFDRNILNAIAALQQGVCIWCKNPQHALRSKGLCTSCYSWAKEQGRLAERVSQLPRRTVRDENFQMRHDLDVANSAVALCKIDGDVLERRLSHTSAIELEQLFDGLSRRILGAKRGARLFHGHTQDFSVFSAAQRSWIWYLVSIVVFEMNRRDRRRIAYRRDRAEKNKRADALVSASRIKG